MNQTDDIEKLFSWLQTPDIRYREFAGAREVTDAVATVQVRTNTPENETPAPHNTQLDEEYPANQFPDQSQTEVEVETVVKGPATNAETPPPAVHHESPVAQTPTPEPSISTDPNEQAPRSLDSVFNRLTGGRR